MRMPLLAPRARSFGLAAMLLIGLAAGPARAEVAPPDPLDIAMRQCQARDDRSSADGQLACVTEARAAWQTAVQTAYERLLQIAPPASRRGWQASQNRWIVWRADEQAFEQGIYETTESSMDAMAQADIWLQAVRYRALVLREVAERAGQRYDRKVSLRSVRRCTDDAECEHAMFDLNRYYAKLLDRLPTAERPQLIKAQAEWNAFREATEPLISESERVDLIGSRVASLKRLAETVGQR